MKRSAAVLLLVLSLSVVSDGAYFLGNAFFSQAPATQMGTIASSNLVINNGPWSITVSGVVTVQVPPGNVSGTLIEYTVDRQLDPTYGTGSMITATTLSGFSQPPNFGTYGNTLGFNHTSLTNYPIVSQSMILMSLTAGATVWNQITVQSSIFTYTSQNGLHYLRQRFELDGVQFNGIGGIWTIDLPVTSEIILVPEPIAAAMALVLALGARVGSRRFRSIECG
jgi:hypothetical protein